MWAAAALASMLGCAADDADDSGAATETPGTGSSGIGESSSGSGSTGADSTTGDAIPSLLAQCDAPEPCDAFAQDPGSNLEEVDPALECAVNQALDSLANGTAAELHSSFCDIGCTGQDVLLVGDGTAYIQTWSTTAETSYDVIQRCSLKDASYFEPCAGPPPTTACAGWSAWMENCEAVESVTCPS
jgi:hypothetical protein